MAHHRSSCSAPAAAIAASKAAKAANSSGKGKSTKPYATSAQPAASPSFAKPGKNTGKKNKSRNQAYPSPPPSPPSSPPPPQKRLRTASTPKWLPHGHHCGHSGCKNKTASPSFRRRCIDKHMEVCRGFHYSLMQKGTAHDCKSCIMERESRFKREEEIRVEEVAVPSKRLAILQAAHLAAEEACLRDKEIRREGYHRWKSS